MEATKQTTKKVNDMKSFRGKDVLEERNVGLRIEELNRKKKDLILKSSEEERRLYLKLGVLPFAVETSMWDYKFAEDMLEDQEVKKYSEEIRKLIKESKSIEELTKKFNESSLFSLNLNEEAVKKLLEDVNLFMYAIAKDYELLEKLESFPINLRWHFRISNSSYFNGNIDPYHFLIKKREREEVERIINKLLDKGVNPFSGIFENALFSSLIGEETREKREKVKRIYEEAIKMSSITIKEMFENSMEIVNGIVIERRESTIHKKIDVYRFCKELAKRGININKEDAAKFIHNPATIR